MVENGDFSHEIDYVILFKEILNPEVHPKCMTGSKVMAYFAEWVDFACWWSCIGKVMHTACKAGLFKLI